MDRLTNGLLNARYAIFAGLLLITLWGAVLVVRSFAIDNSVGIWFARDDSKLTEYQQYLDEFGEVEWTLLMVETEHLESPRFWRDLEVLTDELRGLDHVRRVVSLSSLEKTKGSPTDRLRMLYSHPLARDLLLRPGDSRRTVLLLETDNYLTRQDPYRLELIDAIHATVSSRPTIVDHSVAGTSAINAELNRSAKRDMFVFFTLVTGLVFAISLALFRSLKDAAVLLTVAGGSVVFAMGLIAAAGYSLNMVTIMLPTVLIALSVAGSVHVICAFHRERQSHGADEAVGRAIRQVWLPCLGTSATTIVGFLSLAGSSVLPIFQLALFGSAGIAMAWLMSVLVAPLMLRELWRDRDRRSTANARRGWVEALASGPRRWRAIVVVAFVVASTGLAGLGRLHADTNYAEFFRDGSTLSRDYDAIDAAGFPQNPLVLTAPAPTAPRQWASLRAFADRLRELPEVKHVLAPVGGRAQNPLGLRSDDGRRVQLVLMTNYLSSDELHDLMGRIGDTGAGTLGAEARLGITGTTVLWASMDTQVIATQASSAIIVSVALLTLLTAIFRSLPLAAVGWFVSAFPVALVLGLMGFAGVRINMATVLIAGIALGIAVDDTVHLIFAVRDHLARGGAPRSAAEEALRELAPRLVATSVILIGGFGCMMTSSFLPTANFGLFASLTILVALLCDLLLLPLLLQAWARSWERCRARRARRADAAVATTALALESRRT